MRIICYPLPFHLILLIIWKTVVDVQWERSREVIRLAGRNSSQKLMKLNPWQQLFGARLQRLQLRSAVVADPSPARDEDANKCSPRTERDGSGGHQPFGQHDGTIVPGAVMRIGTAHR